MAVKIRLQRVGMKKKPAYRIVAVDSRKKRDGDVIETIGQYQPVSKLGQFNIDEGKVMDWLKKGAQPSLTILNLLKKNGIWKKYKGDQKNQIAASNG